MKKILLTILFAATISGLAFSTTYETINNGKWNTSSTWKNNQKPGNSWSTSDQVIVKHDIQLDKDVSFNGSLTIQTGASLIGSKKITVDQNGSITANGVVDVKELKFWKSKASYFYNTVDASNKLEIENTSVVFDKFVSTKKLETYLSTVTFNDSVYVSNEVKLEGNTVTFSGGLYSKNKFDAYQCIVNLNGNNYFKKIANGNNDGLDDCTLNSTQYTCIKEDLIIWNSMVNNSGIFIVNDDFDGDGRNSGISNSGTFMINDDFKNWIGNYVNSGTFNVNGKFENEATSFNNTGTCNMDEFKNKWSGNFTNNGNLFIQKELENENNLTNNDSVYIGGDLKNKWGGDIYNYGCIHLVGDFENDYRYTDYQNSCFYVVGDVEIEWGQKITTDGVITANSDVINDGGTIQINQNGVFKVGQKLENKYGAVVVNNGELVIGSGGYVINKSGSSKNGNGKDSKERKLIGGGWHYVSAPVAGAKSNAFWGAALYQFNEVTNQWESIGAHEDLVPLKGYDVYYKNSQTIKFEGEFNDGNYSINLTKANDGWNLLGNPYPSTIDWRSASGWTKNNVENAIYIWDPSAQNITTYINGAGVNGGVRYIAPLQGFLVRCNSTSGGSVSINNNARVEQSVVFREEENEDMMIRLTISSDEFDDETVIRYREGATLDFDFNFDAEKMYSMNSNVPQVFTRSLEGTDCSINSVPESQVGSSVPVYFKAGVTGTHEVSVELENFDLGTMIFLEDKMTGEYHDLLTGSYVFESEVTDDQSRFVVHFLPPQSVNNQDDNNIYTSIEDNIDEGTVHVYSENKTIHITNTIENARLNVTNMLGKVVYSNDNLTEGYSTFTVDLPAGYYIVNISNADNVVSKKLYIR